MFYIGIRVFSPPPPSHVGMISVFACHSVMKPCGSAPEPSRLRRISSRLRPLELPGTIRTSSVRVRRANSQPPQSPNLAGGY